MGSKGGGVFGNVAELLQDVNQKLDPVMKFADPIGSMAVRNTDKFMVKAFNPKMPGMPAPTMLGVEADKAGENKAKASGASSGASTAGGGAKDMATLPPDTPEGARMRLGQPSLLGVTK